MKEATQNFEVYFIINPELTGEGTEKVINSVTENLNTLLKASNVSINKEGIKNLAYPIKKHWSGFYTLITFDVQPEMLSEIKQLERKLNLEESIIRYIIVNQTEFNVQKSKELLNSKPEFNSHRELNKGNQKKKCISTYLGMTVVDYKDADYLSQFTSPYAKVFASEKTGTKAKMQRKITQAIKRSRHMALMPFTAKHFR